MLMLQVARHLLVLLPVRFRAGVAVAWAGTRQNGPKVKQVKWPKHRRNVRSSQALAPGLMSGNRRRRRRLCSVARTRRHRDPGMSRMPQWRVVPSKALTCQGWAQGLLCLVLGDGQVVQVICAASASPPVSHVSRFSYVQFSCPSLRSVPEDNGLARQAQASLTQRRPHPLQFVQRAHCAHPSPRLQPPRPACSLACTDPTGACRINRAAVGVLLAASLSGLSLLRMCQRDCASRPQATGQRGSAPPHNVLPSRQGRCARTPRAKGQGGKGAKGQRGEVTASHTSSHHAIHSTITVGPLKGKRFEVRRKMLTRIGRSRAGAKTTLSFLVR